MNEFDDYLTKQRNNPSVVLLPANTSIATIARNVTAFLNSSGGTIVIRDYDQEFSDIEKELREELPVATLFSVQEQKQEETNERYTFITVPPRRDNPVNYKGDIFIRDGVDSKVPDASTLHHMLQEQAVQGERWERRLSVGLTIDDLNNNEINTTLIEMMQRGLFNASEGNTPNALSLAKQLGFLRPDSTLTQAADICLAKNPTIRHPQVHLRAFAFESETSDKFQGMQDFAGPICDIFQSAENFINQNTRSGVSFPDHSSERETNYIYPKKAIREGLINALAHRDYSSYRGGITLRIYPTRIEIWNSGSLPEGWDIKKLNTTILSYPTNPDIANFLYQRNFMERIGRGTQKIIEACKEAKLPKPQWKNDDGVTLILFRPINREFALSKINERQQALLNSLQLNESFKSKDYHQGIGSDVSERQGRRDLSELEELQLILRKGSGPATHYIRT